MKATELNRDQISELKERIVFERNTKAGEPTYMSDLAEAENCVSDEEVFAEYADTDFTDDDFFCSCGGDGGDGVGSHPQGIGANG